MTRRREDMGAGSLELDAQDDGDIIVTVREAGEGGFGQSVEFCSSGNGSPKTLKALRQLMIAMAEDDRDRPQRQHDWQQMYYVADTRRWSSDMVLWWGINRAGYTTRLSKAGLYTREQIERMRPTDVGWPKEIVDAVMFPCVSRSELGNNNEACVRGSVR